MWKYRSEFIFGAAFVFAVETAVRPSPTFLAATFLFLSAHYVDRFYGMERANKKVEEKLKDYEEELKGIKNDLTRIGLSMGIRGNIGGGLK